VVGYYVVKAVLKNPLDSLTTEKVAKGIVLQEVSETGSVNATENISLGFKSVGKISNIYVAVGDSIKKGNVLAELGSSQISAQLQSAEAALDSANNQYNKLINGLTPGELKIYVDAVTSANQDLANAYNGGINTLNSAHTSIYNTYSTAVTIQNDYFSTQDQQGIAVSNARSDINSRMQDVENYLNTAEKSMAPSDIETTVAHMISALNTVYDDINIIRAQCDQGIYYFSVTSADKTSLDTQKTAINTALTNVTTLQHNIASLKIALQQAEDNLSSKTANARPEDIDISQSQIEQAQASVYSLQSQMDDNYLISPMDGTITAVNIKKGEVVSPNESVINLLSAEPFQIKAGIYEQDVVNVKVGDGVIINLVAFPRQTFDGKVLSINPAETIIDNVVYYEVTIEFSNQPAGIKSGMTADIVIEANKKDNVLRIPKNAVMQLDGTETVQIINGPKIENRTITTGLEGNDYFEVVSGLTEGDEIVTGRK
jgi:RND family efflux transporter MFP subunit